MALIRRSAVIVILVVALASLVSEFPASASGRALVAQVSVVRGL